MIRLICCLYLIVGALDHTQAAIGVKPQTLYADGMLWLWWLHAAAAAWLAGYVAFHGTDG